MADYRQIHTKIWKDGWFIELSDQEKLLFIYLFSNERASIAGLYELALRVICFETGLDKRTVEAALAKFSKAGKAHYENGIVWVVNLRKYNENSSPKVTARLSKDLAAVADCPIKRRYLAYYNPIESDGYGIDTVSIPVLKSTSEQEQEHEQEQEQEKHAGDKPPAPECLPQPDPVLELAEVFEQVSGVKRPTPSGKKAKDQVGVTWWHPLREMVKMANGNSAEVLRAAVSQLRAKNLNVSSPQSCLKTFTSLHGAAVTGATASLAAQYRAAGYTDANGNPV